MKIKIVSSELQCPPCQSLIDTVEELALTDLELNLSYEVLIKNTVEADLVIQEQLDRGFPLIGAPLWILYDDADNYVKTFLGFPLPEYGAQRLEILKDNILLKNDTMNHPTHNIWEKN